MNHATALLRQVSRSILVAGLLCLGATTSSHAQTTPASGNASTFAAADSNLPVTSSAYSEIHLLPPPAPLSESISAASLIDSTAGSALFASGNRTSVGGSQPVTKTAESERAQPAALRCL
jgi:hypothetical protein